MNTPLQGPDHLPGPAALPETATPGRPFGRRLGGLEGQLCNTRIRMPSLSAWIKAGNKCGIKARNILAGHGITVAPVYPHTRVEHAQVLRALGDCVVATRHDHFPLALGNTYTFDDFPSLRTFLLSSADLREFVRNFNAVKDLVHPWAMLELHESPEGVRISTDVPVPGSDRHPYRYIIEATLALVVRLLSTYLGRHFALLHVDFRHADPPYARHYPGYFGILPRFERADNAVVLDRLALEFRQTEAALQAHEKSKAAVMVRLALQQRDVAHEIETLLRQRHEMLGAHMDEIARHFGMTPLALQRHLKQEGARFSDIQGHVRHELARVLLLQPALSVAEVSRQLGYANRRAFTSAFKARGDLTPTEYRARHAAQ